MGGKINFSFEIQGGIWKISYKATNFYACTFPFNFFLSKKCEGKLNFLDSFMNMRGEHILGLFWWENKT